MYVSLGEHQTKYYDRPVEALGEMEILFSKQRPVLESQEGEHMSTVIRQVRGTPMIYDDRLHQISGEHTLTVLDSSTRQTNQGPDHQVEFIVPKTSSNRLINTASNRDEEETLRRYYRYTEEEEGEIDRTGEHSTTYIKQARAKYEPIELVVDRPKQLPSVATLIADIPAPGQITSIRPTTVFLEEDSSVQLAMQLDSDYHQERFDEMELVLEKPIVRDSSTTLLANIQPGFELKSMQATTQVEKRTVEESSSSFTLQRERESEEESVELRLRKPHVQDSSSVLLANIQPQLGVQGRLKASPYLPQPQETSTTALTMEMNKHPDIAPFELIIPRMDVESSTSTILAQVSPALAGLRAQIDVPSVEKSTSSFVLEQKRQRDEEIELIMPKPKRLETSTSTMLADVQAKLETKHIRPSDFQPEAATSTFYFDETTTYVTPQPVELRLKQPVVGDSSSTIYANVKATIDTNQTQVLGTSQTSYEQSSSAVLLDTQPNVRHPPEVELILPRPQVQESTSVLFADVRPTLDTSEQHLVLPRSPLPLPVNSSSEMILEQTTRDTAPVELHLHRQPSSHTVLATVDYAGVKHRETYILGTNLSQDQQYGYQVTGGAPVLHVDVNKPVELVFNLDEGSSSVGSQQFRRDYNTRMLTSNTSGIDSSSTLVTGQSLNLQKKTLFLVNNVHRVDLFSRHRCTSISTSWISRLGWFNRFQQ